MRVSPRTTSRRGRVFYWSTTHLFSTTSKSLASVIGSHESHRCSSRYKKSDDRGPMDDVMIVILPLLQQRFMQLFAHDDSDPSALIQKQILKIFHAYTQVSQPPQALPTSRRAWMRNLLRTRSIVLSSILHLQCTAGKIFFCSCISAFESCPIKRWLRGSTFAAW